MKIAQTKNSPIRSTSRHLSNVIDENRKHYSEWRSERFTPENNTSIKCDKSTKDKELA